MNIVGQAAIVIGGASGLGAQTARELARRGARVAEFDRNGAGAAAVAAVVAAHGQAIGVACDITSTDSLLAALQVAREAHGPARLLMTVAGIGTARRLIGKGGTPMTLEDFRRVVKVNLSAPSTSRASRWSRWWPRWSSSTRCWTASAA